MITSDNLYRLTRYYLSLKNGFISLFAIAAMSQVAFSQVTDNSLDLDGTNDYLNLNILGNVMSQSEQEFTVEFWMNADQLDQQSGPRVTMFAINPIPSGADNEFLILMGGTGTTQEGRLVIYDDRVSGSKFVLASQRKIGDNQCHHIAFVRKGNIGEAFIDGISIGTYTAKFILPISHRYSIGQDWDGNTTSEFFNGQVDDFRIWKTARTQVEIDTYKDTGVSKSDANLIVMYRMDQGTSNGNNTMITNVLDETTSNYDATMLGFTKNGNSSNWILDSCQMFNEDLAIDVKKLCLGDSTSFELISNTDSTVYWNFGEPLSGLNNDAKGKKVKHRYQDTGSFKITVYTDDPRHKDTLTEWVHVQTFSFSLGLDTSLCEGETINLNVSIPNDSLFWNDSYVGNNRIITQTGAYEATVWKDNCSFTDTINIQYIPLPRFDLGPDQFPCYKDGFTVSSISPVDSLFWEDGSTQANRSLSQTTLVKLTVYYNGCSYSDQVNVSFTSCQCDIGSLLPNSFSPNSDDINETFPPSFDCPYSYYHLRIYNRWGEKIVDSVDPLYKWDGTYMNRNCQFGVYMYQLDFKSPVGQLNRSLAGTIHLHK